MVTPRGWSSASGRNGRRPRGRLGKRPDLRDQPADRKPEEAAEQDLPHPTKPDLDRDLLGMVLDSGCDDDRGRDGRLPPHDRHPHDVAREQRGRRQGRGSFQSLDAPSAPPSIRNARPVAHPSKALMTRPRTLLIAWLTCGSLDASIALIAQIGFRPAHFRITSQSRHVATNTFKARCTPARSAAIRRRGGPIGKTTRVYSWAVGGLPLRR